MPWAEMLLVAIMVGVIGIVAKWWLYDQDSFYENMDDNATTTKTNVRTHNTPK